MTAAGERARCIRLARDVVEGERRERDRFRKIGDWDLARAHGDAAFGAERVVEALMRSQRRRSCVKELSIAQWVAEVKGDAT